MKLLYYLGPDRRRYTVVKTTAGIVWEWVQAFTTLVLFALIIVILLDGPYLTYGKQPFTVLGSGKYRPGEVVPILVERCSTARTGRSYVFTHQLNRLDVDAPAVIMDPKIVPIYPGCHPVESRVNIVPIDTPPGRYFVSGVAEIQGSIRSFAIEWQSAPFEVVR